MQTLAKKNIGKKIAEGVAVVAITATLGTVVLENIYVNYIQADKTCRNQKNEPVDCSPDMKKTINNVYCAKDQKTYGTISDCGGPEHYDCLNLHESGTGLREHVIVDVKGPSQRKGYYLIRVKDLGDGTTFEKEVPSCD
jgi:hypothetical protein